MAKKIKDTFIKSKADKRGKRFADQIIKNNVIRIVSVNKISDAELAKHFNRRKK